VFPVISVSFVESYLIVLWCAGGRCGMTCNDEDRGRSRRPGAEDQRCHIDQVLGSRVIERSGGVMCSLHRAHGDEKRGFLG
jgi:hypothetical protein